LEQFLDYIFDLEIGKNLGIIKRKKEAEPILFTLQKLFKAYFSCRKLKRKTINALKFEINCELKLLAIQKELQNHIYRPGRSACFAIIYPKLREIFAADFRDRIIHHLLINEIEPYFDRRFIFDSFACRKEKGSHKALFRLRKFICQITKNKTQNAFYLQLDVKSFFSTIDKNILYAIIKREIFQKEILWLAKTIIFHDPTRNYFFKGEKDLFKQIPAHKSLFNAPENKGLPIGNLTSQFFGNVYLNELDQFVKRKLKVKYYLRYVDDLVLLSENPEQLKEWRKEIDHFLKEKLKLELHPKKDKSGSVYQGVDFVGYIVKPNYVLSRKRVIGNLKTKLHYFNQGLLLVSNNQKQMILPISKPPGKKEIKTMLAIVNSYYGHFKHGNCYRLRKNIYEKHFGELKKYLKPTKDYRCFKL